MRLVLALTVLLMAAAPDAAIGKATRYLKLSQGLKQKLKQQLLATATVGLALLAPIAPIAADDNAEEVMAEQEAAEDPAVEAADIIEDDIEDKPAWFKLKANSPAHHRSVFYLLIDMFEHWRVVHVGYVGDDRDGEPLFVGLRTYTRFGEDSVFRFALSSLVGHNGLVQENINIEEVEVFPTAATIPYFDIALYKINGIDMSAYEPIKLARYVELFADVEMLSYRIDLADNLLAYFDYPLRYRHCNSGRMASVANHMLLTNTCGIPYTPAVTGSPIFNDKTELLGLYVGWLNEANHLAVTMPKALLDLNAFAINKKNKLPVLWGELKK